MELLVPNDKVKENWLAALCICSGHCIAATGDISESQTWDYMYTQSVLEWLNVPYSARDDLVALPHGEAANDIILHMLRQKQTEEAEMAKGGDAKPSKSLEITNDPDKLFSGLILTCIGVGESQLSQLRSQDSTTADVDSAEGDRKLLLRPFEYDSRSRAAAFMISEWLNMPKQFVPTYEDGLSKELIQILFVQQKQQQNQQLAGASAEALDSEKSRKWGWKKYLATGAGVAVAGTLVGVTAGLAAPLIVAGMGAVGLGGIGFLATTGGAAMVGTLFGATGGGLIGTKIRTRFRGLHMFYFSPLYHSSNDGVSNKHYLHATIFVPGFLRASDTKSPFAPVTSILGFDLGESYTLYFEPRELMELENAFSGFIESSAKGAATTLVLQQTILHTLMGALTWPLALLKLGKLIDAPWSVGLSRARKAGKLLADVLAQRAHGKRPVTLVGYSLGALAIFTCLQELHSRNVYGVVDSAVLLGMPADGSDTKAWTACCQCVSRKVIVGYSKKDWILAFLLRASSFCTHLAGLTGVDVEKLFPASPLLRRKLVCLDLSETVSRHLDYLYLMDDVMTEVSRVL